MQCLRRIIELVLRCLHPARPFARRDPSLKIAPKSSEPFRGTCAPSSGHTDAPRASSPSCPASSSPRLEHWRIEKLLFRCRGTASYVALSLLASQLPTPLIIPAFADGELPYTFEPANELIMMALVGPTLRTDNRAIPDPYAYMLDASPGWGAWTC